jgi:hypothetical protein
MGAIVTPEDKAKFDELNRIRMKLYRDKTRQRKYAPRGKHRLDESVQSNEGKKE